jgi:hypothetical protein
MWNFVHSGESKYKAHNYPGRLFSLKEIELFDDVNDPLLVFRRNKWTQIKHCDKTGTETVPNEDEDPGQFIDYVSALGEYILGDRYRLFGAIHLRTRPGKQGKHYTTYLRRHDAWYFYDDAAGAGGHLRPLRALPFDTFKSFDMNRRDSADDDARHLLRIQSEIVHFRLTATDPHLLFYERIPK